jgi:hypothetical protein
VNERAAGWREAERERAAEVAEFEAAAAPLLDALRTAGLPTEGFGRFVSSEGAKYFGVPAFDHKASVPILLEWLPRIEHPRVKDAIVGHLSTRYARGVAARPLVAEFLAADDDTGLGLKWSIGSALEAVADESVFDELAAIALERRHGRAREMVVLALGRMKDRRATEVLLQLLDDPDVNGHAVSALAKLAPPTARSALRRFLDDERAWVRKAALRGLARIDRSEAGRSSS